MKKMALLSVSMTRRPVSMGPLASQGTGEPVTRLAPCVSWKISTPTALSEQLASPSSPALPRHQESPQVPETGAGLGGREAGPEAEARMAHPGAASDGSLSSSLAGQGDFSTPSEKPWFPRPGSGQMGPHTGELFW